MNDPVIVQVMNEQSQGPNTRTKLFAALEKEIKRPVISFFTSFRYPVSIEDADADMLEGVLRKMDLSNGFALIINSPGGDGIAAERIINTCRTYSGTGEFWAIVPAKAKSAATIICFGSSKIFMSGSSELGPIDPQLIISEDGKTVKRFSVYNVVESYDDLFSKAINARGRIEPYLQQLSKYDERDIKEHRAALSLSEDIAIKLLSSGMMHNLSQKEIKKKIEIFLTPKKTKTHARAIYRDEAASCGLNIDSINEKCKMWELIYELYIRTNNYVSTKAVKCIESRQHGFFAPVPSEGE
jgi:hypothetical protein